MGTPPAEPTLFAPASISRELPLAQPATLPIIASQSTRTLGILGDISSASRFQASFAAQSELTGEKLDQEFRGLERCAPRRVTV